MEYIVEAVDEVLVVNIQVQTHFLFTPAKHSFASQPDYFTKEKQALFYPDLDYTEESSEEVVAETEGQKEDEEYEEFEDLTAEEDEPVEYDYTLVETSGTIVVLGAPSAELDYVAEDTRSEMEKEEKLLEIDAIVNQVELDEAAKYDHFNGDRKIFEIVIMSGRFISQSKIHQLYIFTRNCCDLPDVHLWPGHPHLLLPPRSSNTPNSHHRTSPKANTGELFQM